MSKIKTLLGALLISLCIIHTHAQDKRTSVYGIDLRTNSFEVGASYYTPLGSFAQTYTDGVGLEVKYRSAITEFKSALLSVGYSRFNGEVKLAGNNPVAKLGANFLPIKAGMKFRFLKYIYLAGEIGVTVPIGISGLDDVNVFVVDQYRINGALFNFIPTFGVQIPTNGKNYVDLSFSYQGMSNNQNTLMFTGIRAAYAIDVARPR